MPPEPAARRTLWQAPQPEGEVRCLTDRTLAAHGGFALSI